MEDANQWGMLLKTLGSLGAVIALIYALKWLAERYLRPGKLGGSSLGNIRVLDSFALGPNKKLVIVEVESKKMLLGIGQHSISQLGVLDGPRVSKQKLEVHHGEAI